MEINEYRPEIAAENVMTALDIEMANGFDGEADKLAEAGLEHTAADGDINPTATEKAELGIGGGPKVRGPCTGSRSRRAIRGACVAAPYATMCNIPRKIGPF